MNLLREIRCILGLLGEVESELWEGDLIGYEVWGFKGTIDGFLSYET